ncbi:unnamed protein product [Dovyalis caffra]|uniref:Uncharacterized protein n=1 Tax=Dovyalis caffra TaxID=77055 RepID=A0AAV1RTK3_9ROSI|nr:unnamed protein product [Dovyalis caffra]
MRIKGGTGGWTLVGGSHHKPKIKMITHLECPLVFGRQPNLIENNQKFASQG